MAFCEAWPRNRLNVVPGPYVSDVRVSSEVNVVVTEGFTFVEDNMAVSNFPGLALSDWEEHWTLPTHSEGAPTVRPTPTTWRAEQLAEHPWAAEYVRRGTARSSTDTPEVEDDTNGTSDDEISARWTPRSAFGLDGVVQSDAESMVMAEEWCAHAILLRHVACQWRWRVRIFRCKHCVLRSERSMESFPRGGSSREPRTHAGTRHRVNAPDKQLVKCWEGVHRRFRQDATRLRAEFSFRSPKKCTVIFPQ